MGASEGDQQGGPGGGGGSGRAVEGPVRKDQ